MKGTVKQLLRQVAGDTPIPPLHSVEAYREWLRSLTDEEFERERISQLDDATLLAELAECREAVRQATTEDV